MAQLVNITKTLQLKKDATVGDFTIWSIQYLALMSKEDFKKIMLGNETMPATDQAKIDDFKKQNNDGFAHLLFTVTNKKDVKTVAGSSSTEHPDGCLKTA